MLLTVNAGSSSLHLALVEGDAVADRLDLTGPAETESTDAAVAAFVKEHPAPDAVGHRLVHGGDVVLRPTVVDDALLAAVRSVTELAPLHLPPALHLVEVLRAWLPDVPHVLCPDTGFHSDLPEHAATYPLPAAWRERYRGAYSLRRYGFHGLSYAWATRRAAQLLDRPVTDLRMVLAHLGGGASVCAVWGGRSVDTSMGFTPLDGVPMSTRSGAIDPGLLLWLLQPGRLSLDELGEGLNHHAGLLGLSGDRSGDTRELVAAAAAEDARAALALAVFAHRVRREIAAAATNLDRLDAVVFTGEIGWDQPEVRHAVCAGLRVLGVPLPARGNLPQDGLISPDGAALPVLVVQPREELQLAEDVRQVV